MLFIFHLAYFQFFKCPIFFTFLVANVYGLVSDQVIDHCGQLGNHSDWPVDHCGIMNDHCGRSGNHSDRLADHCGIMSIFRVTPDSRETRICVQITYGNLSRYALFT